jgi:CRP-like cAMP-binding protein
MRHLRGDLMAELSELFLLKGTDRSLIDRIKNDIRCEIHDYSAGQIIYSRDCFRRSLGFLMAGNAIVRSSGAIMRRLLEGSAFGAAALFSDKEHYVTEIEAESACRVAFLDESLVIDIMQTDFRAVQNYIRFQSDRINFLNMLIDGYSAQSIDSKLAHFLISSEDGNEISLEFNMSKLSEALGIGRASLYRVLGAMEKDGILRRDGKQIRIIDIAALKKRL